MKVIFFMSSGDVCILQSRKAFQDLVSKNSLQSFKKMRNGSFKGWAWLLLSYLHFWILRICSSEHWNTSCFSLNRFSFEESPNWFHRAVIQPTKLKTDLQHYHMAIRTWGFFRNTLNFFKPLPSGKKSRYYGGRGQFVWLICKYVILTWLSREAVFFLKNTPQPCLST